MKLYAKTDGIPVDIQTLLTEASSEISTEEASMATDLEEASEVTGTPSTSFIPQPQNIPREEDAIRSAIDGQDSLDWPALGKIPSSSLLNLITYIIPPL